LFGGQGLGVPFPISDFALMHADFIGEHLLRGSALFARKKGVIPLFL
jgi:hypothetical protein